MALDFKLKTILIKAREVYGDNFLIDLAIEEMGELIVALNHYRRNRAEKDEVQEEIADVMLAVQELQQIFGLVYIVDYYRAKCERFEQRVNNDALRVEKDCSQYCWKPNDEQIDALDFAADCIVPAEFCVKRKVLKELLVELKKKKGE